MAMDAANRAVDKTASNVLDTHISPLVNELSATAATDASKVQGLTAGMPKGSMLGAPASPEATGTSLRNIIEGIHKNIIDTRAKNFKVATDPILNSAEGRVPIPVDKVDAAVNALNGSRAATPKSSQAWLDTVINDLRPVTKRPLGAEATDGADAEPTITPAALHVLIKKNKDIINNAVGAQPGVLTAKQLAQVGQAKQIAPVLDSLLEDSHDAIKIANKQFSTDSTVLNKFSSAMHDAVAKGGGYSTEYKIPAEKLPANLFANAESVRALKDVLKSTPEYATKYPQILRQHALEYIRPQLEGKSAAQVKEFMIKHDGMLRESGAKPAVQAQYNRALRADTASSEINRLIDGVKDKTASVKAYQTAINAITDTTRTPKERISAIDSWAVSARNEGRITTAEYGKIREDLARASAAATHADRMRLLHRALFLGGAGFIGYMERNSAYTLIKKVIK
jgi:hypothetical protein